MTPTLIYKFNGIAVYDCGGTYKITDGVEVYYMGYCPVFDADLLKQLLKDKVGVQQFTAAANKVKVNTLSKGDYFGKISMNDLLPAYGNERSIDTGIRFINYMEQQQLLTEQFNY